MLELPFCLIKPLDGLYAGFNSILKSNSDYLNHIWSGSSKLFFMRFSLWYCKTYTSKYHFNFLVCVEFFFYILFFIKQFEAQLRRKILFVNFLVLTILFSVFLSSLFRFVLCVNLFQHYFPFLLSHQFSFLFFLSRSLY